MPRTHRATDTMLEERKNMLEGTKRTLRKNDRKLIEIRFVEKTVQPSAIKLFRTQSPRHFEGGDWDQGGSCQRLQPLSSKEVEELFSLTKKWYECGSTPCESTPVQVSQGIKFPHLRYYPHERVQSRCPSFHNWRKET